VRHIGKYFITTGETLHNESKTSAIDKLVKKNELGQPFTLIDHQREVLRLAFAFNQDDGTMTLICGIKEPFGITSPTRFRFSLQR
jgi:hypothetical protein